MLTTKPMPMSKLMNIVEDIRKNPWNYRKEPFRILNNIYYVGNQWVAAYLIDTENGLILIDSNFDDVVWLLLENIRKLGFDPKDIKLLLLSHGHFDHIGGARYIQSCCDCQTWFPKDDLFMLKERRDLLFGEVANFRIDKFYDYNSAINLGNMAIYPIHSPGHTKGCTSLMFETEFNGKKYKVASHGGLGSNGLTQAELIENDLPLNLGKQYLDGLDRLAKIDADVFLPMHNTYYDIFSLAGQDDGSHSAFIRPGEWKRVMEERARLFRELTSQENAN